MRIEHISLAFRIISKYDSEASLFVEQHNPNDCNLSGIRLVIMGRNGLNEIPITDSIDVGILNLMGWVNREHRWIHAIE